MFPESFVWGVSSSSFQFEMGDSLRRFIDPNSDWWHWSRDPHNIREGRVSGDLPEEGVDYASRYAGDHMLAQELGLNTIRIQVEWSRIFPCPTTGVEAEVRRDGLGLISDVRLGEEEMEALSTLANWREVNRYRQVINDAQRRGLKVIVNLHHFTLPHWLHDPLAARDTGLRRGPLGVLEEAFIIEFAKYAAFTAHALGDIVDRWSTFNEPLALVEEGFLNPKSGFPPGVESTISAAKGVQNLVIAHARAYDQVKRWDRREAGDWGRGPASVGLIIDIIPAHSSPEGGGSGSVAGAYDWFRNRMFLEAITRCRFDLELTGDTTHVSHVGPRLDWLGMNYYTRRLLRRHGGRRPPMLDFKPVAGGGAECTPRGTSIGGNPCDDVGREVYPQGLLEALQTVLEYSPQVLITENGVADGEDRLRPRYIASHLSVVEEALQTGFRVEGYMHWALTDNYEWSRGFAPRFGLYEVDLATKERRPRRSARVLKTIIEKSTARGYRL